MADLPRYQDIGVQYADLPRVSTASQQAAVQGLSNIERSLDRMNAYVEDAAVTEAKKAAIKYSVENPPTHEQLKEALANPKEFKLPGAKAGGRIFQETYRAAAAAQLSSELLLAADNESDNIERQYQMGLIDKNKAQTKLADLMDGQSALMVQVSPEYSLKHRASLAAVASTSFKKISELELKTYMGEKKAEYTSGLLVLGKKIEDTINQQIGTIDPETGKPVDINLMIQTTLQKYTESIKVLGGSTEIFDKAQVIAEGAKRNALASYATSSEFGENRLDRLNKTLAGDFGKMTPIWKGMGEDQKKDARKVIIEQLNAEKQTRDLFLASEQFDANDILRKMYMSNNPGMYFKQLKDLAVDPSTLKSAREYLDSQTTMGPKVDDLSVLAKLTAAMANGTATTEDVINARRVGKLKNDTAKSLIIGIANPSDDISWGVKQIELAVNISNAQLPAELPTKEARAIATTTKNTGELELRKYASTPDKDGKYPTPEEIRKKAMSIRDNASELIKPYLIQANNQAAESVRIQLKELDGVDLSNDAEFNAAVAKAVKNKADANSISAARIAREKWLETQKKIEAK
jgi:hypothetical protein